MCRQRSVLMVLLLSIVTCGIYSFFWVYSTRQEMNAYLNDNSKSPELNTILAILCSIYWLFIMYDYSSDITKMQQKAGLPVKDLALLNLLLSIFGFGIVSILIMQSQLNEIYASKSIAE